MKWDVNSSVLAYVIISVVIKTNIVAQLISSYLSESSHPRQFTYCKYPIIMISNKLNASLDSFIFYSNILAVVTSNFRLLCLGISQNEQWFSLKRIKTSQWLHACERLIFSCCILGELTHVLS